MSSYKEIIVTHKKRVTVITFNRPQKKNAINMKMYLEVIKALEEAASDDSVSITVLTGAGNCYTSGNDFSPPTEGDTSNLFSDSSRIVQKFIATMIDHPKILVAVVNGPAVGVGATTLALCDVVYCTPEAIFLTPFSKLGITAEGCSSYTFPRILGTSRASEMLYFGRRMSAQEAVQAGLASEIIPRDQIDSVLYPRLEKYAEELPQKSLIYSKELVRKFDKEHLHAANKREFERLEERWTSEEFFQSLAKFFMSKM